MPAFAAGDRIVYHDPLVPFLDFPGVVVAVGSDPKDRITVRLDDPLPERPHLVDVRADDVHAPGARCARCAPLA